MANRIPGVFVPLDVDFQRDLQRVDPESELLYLRALAHCKKIGSHGRITPYDLGAIGVGIKAVPKRVDALVRERFWQVTEGGWIVRSWLKWNSSAQEMAEQKQKKVDAAVKTNHTRWHTDGRTDDACPHCPTNVHRMRDRA